MANSVHGIEIPGYEIRKEIGRGGMAQVHLAVQKKFGRLVALKVVTADYSTDSRFKERFIRESRINARLTHPNIVQVYDVGSFEQWLYLVLEYIRGGDLDQRLERGMQVFDLLRVVRDMCKALDYAHGKGFVHRDIKPENILFREDGSAVLTDFGIARFTDSGPTITRVGTVVGTPQYMSPEQAAGRELDGRSDLYSLGIVFYRMLTGEVPFKADSAVSIGIRHLQDPIPRLPSHLAVFQPIIDKCLAKKPEQRYQTGAELSAALDTIRVNDDVPNTTLKTQAVTTQEIRAVGHSVLMTARDPVRQKRQSERRRRQQLTRRSLMVVLLMALITLVGYVFVEQPGWSTRLLSVAGLIEDPLAQEAWNDARSLHQDPNQGLSAIVAGYRRVIAIDPDHLGAKQAIDGLASQWRSSFANALVQGDLNQAETKLDESTAAFPQDPGLADLRSALTDRRHAESLLASTQALLRSHGLSDIPSATAAIQAYQEVLRLAPVHPVAQGELDTLAIHYAELATVAAGEGEVEDAINFLDRASAANSELALLDDVRDSIRQATTLQAAIVDMLQEASSLRVAGSLINPPGENAAEIYHRVLATDPDNVIATQGLNEVESQLLTITTQLLSLGRIAEVQALLDRSGAVGLSAVAINEMTTRLNTEVTRLETVASRLTDAESLLVQGYITEPPESNAVALLRDVQRLDPGNEYATKLLAQSAQRLVQVAHEAYDVGFHDQAIHYLGLALTVTPDVPAWRKLRVSWDDNATRR